MLTWIEIDSRKLKHNLLQLRKLIGSKTLLMPVIKGNAYGHGFLEVASLCNKSSVVDRLCVASLEEAINLIKAGLTKKPILILSFYELDTGNVITAIKYGVSFVVYDLKQAAFLNVLALRLGKRVKIHLKIDTGTSRLGVLHNETLFFVKKLQKYTRLTIEGVFTHFAASECNSRFTKQQLQSFNGVQQTIQKLIPNKMLWHASCTAATMLHTEAQKDAVRVGVGLYGLHPSSTTQRVTGLKPVLAWYTKIIQVKSVPKGTAIGYDCTYHTKRVTQLGIIPIGYFDGFDRRFSNNGFVLVRGVKCSILGRICMNLTMIDVTDVPKKVKVGDKVTIIGQDKQESISAEMWSKLAKTIHYEIIDRINPQLPRIVI